MTSSLLLAATLLAGQPEVLAPGNYTRTTESGGLKRSSLIHVPPSYQGQPTPVVLALHGLSMNAAVMAWFTGLNKVSDREGFIVIYPNGTGPIELLRGWNAGAFPGDSAKDRPDDVAYLRQVLDDAESFLSVDPKRIYVAGMSNGAMMAYRLACAMPERIAAIAPVAGTMATEECQPKRPVPVIHFHGTADTLVPFDGFKKDLAKVVKVKSVPDTIETWVNINRCDTEPTITELPLAHDKLKVTRKEYKCDRGADVVLYVIDGGGHSWPGMHFEPPFLGPSTDNVSANEAMWEFFKKHPLP